MKNTTKLFIAAAFLSVGMASAQSGVGVGTTTPATGTALHVDGAKDNTSVTPTATEAANDVVVTSTGNVGIGTATPGTSAALDVTSTTKGLLIPRMTTSQRTAIATPATGLQVYDTTTNSQWFYNGTVWLESGIATLTSKWTNDATNARIVLTNLSDGSTARPTGKEFVITDAGNVGIGTSTPNRNFHVVSSDGDNTMKLEDIQNNAWGPTLRFINNRGGNVTNINDESGFISFGLYNTNNIETHGSRISAMVKNNITGSESVDLKFTTRLNGAVVNAMYMKENGDVGISTLTPTVRLDVNGYLKLANADVRGDLTPVAGMIRYNAGLQFYNGTSWISSYSNWTLDNANSRMYLTKLSNNLTNRPVTAQLTVTDSGNVGIGNLVPTEKLDVTGAAKFGSNGRITYIGTSGGTSPNGTYIGHNVYRNYDYGTTTPNLFISQASSSSIFKGSSVIFTNAETNNVYFANFMKTDGTVSENFNILTESYLVVDNNKNIGIGTTTPTEKLQVNGAIKIGSTSAATPTAGTIRFNTTTSKFEGYDGTAWVAFH